MVEISWRTPSILMFVTATPGSEAEQHAAQRISEGNAVASLKRFDNEFYVFSSSEGTVEIFGFSISIINNNPPFLSINSYVCQFVSDRIVHPVCRLPRTADKSGEAGYYLE